MFTFLMVKKKLSIFIGLNILIEVMIQKLNRQNSTNIK